MNMWVEAFIAFYGLLGLIFCIVGFIECNNKNNVMGVTEFLFPLGIFVWGDAVIFGIFWFLVSLTSIMLRDWILFLLFLSVFWLVRSVGETLYWFNQQFSKVVRHPPHTLRHYNFFKSDAIWFIYQIGWQCVTVLTIITTIYLSAIWLHGKI